MPKKKAGARKKKGSKKAARRKAERKRKTARRKSSRSGQSAEQGPRKASAARRHPARPGNKRPALRLPERVGFIRVDSAGGEIASLQLERGEVQAGDAIHVLGPESDFYQRVENFSVAGKRVAKARAGDDVSLRVTRPVRANDAVHLLSR